MIPCTIAPIRMIEQITIISFSTLLPAWLQALPAQHISPQIVSQLWQLDLAPHLPSNISQHAPSDYTTVPRQSYGQHKKKKTTNIRKQTLYFIQKGQQFHPIGQWRPTRPKKNTTFYQIVKSPRCAHEAKRSTWFSVSGYMSGCCAAFVKHLASHSVSTRPLKAFAVKIVRPSFLKISAATHTQKKNYAQLAQIMCSHLSRIFVEAKYFRTIKSVQSWKRKTCQKKIKPNIHVNFERWLTALNSFRT